MSAKALKAWYSSPKSMIQEWAMVPATGIPYFFPARVLLVTSQPPI